MVFRLKGVTIRTINRDEKNGGACLYKIIVIRHHVREVRKGVHVHQANERTNEYRVSRCCESGIREDVGACISGGFIMVRNGLLSICAFFVLSLSSCDGTAKSAVADLTSGQQQIGVEVARIRSGATSNVLRSSSTEDSTITPLVSDAELLAIFGPELDSLLNADVEAEIVGGTLEITDGGTSVAELSNVYIEGTKNRYYLVAKGLRDGAEGNCLTIAFPLKAVERLTPQAQAGGTVYATSSAAKHSCSGDKCSSCSFTRNLLGAITGCKCNKYGRCNHTVNSG